MLPNILERCKQVRCRFDNKYDCHEQIKTGKEKWNYFKSCEHCQIFIHTGQNHFSQEGEPKTTEFMNKLHDKALEQLESLPLTEIADKETVKLMNAKMKVDTRGNECVYLYLKTTSAKMITQKYPPSSFKILEDAIQKAGGYETLQTGFYEWKKQTIGRLKFDRLLPLPKPKERVIK
jgi:hypothetical protein